MSDPFWSNVSLLLRLNGIDGGTTFIDSSGYAHTPSIVSGAIQTSDTQVKFGSTSCDLTDNTGAADYLGYNLHTAFGLGTDDFTIEGWFYCTGSTSTNISVAWYINFVGASNGASGGVYDNEVKYRASGSSTITSGPIASLLNGWHHIAWVKNGSGANNITIYVDGTSVAQGTYTTNFGATNTFRLGSNLTGFRFLGYIDEFRVTKGVARYTANFTPPIAEFPGPPPVEGSFDGSFPKLQGLWPHWSNTSLLLHMEGPDGSSVFKDTSGHDNTINPFGEIQISDSQSKFGTTSCDHTDVAAALDYLAIPSSSKFGFESGDWTVEGWFYGTGSGSTTISIAWQAGLLNNPTGITGGVYDNQVQFRGNGSVTITSGDIGSITNSWHHVAWVRQGSGSNNVKIYLDGIAVAQGTYTNVLNSSDTFEVGAKHAPPFRFVGYIDEFRVVKGIAVYRNNFTPPNEPFEDGPLHEGEFIGSLSSLESAFIGESDPIPVMFSGEFPQLSGAFEGLTGIQGAIDGSFPRVEGSFAASDATPGFFFGDLPSMGGSFSSQVSFDYTFSAHFGEFEAGFSGQPGVPGSIVGTIPELESIFQGAVGDEYTFTAAYPSSEGVFSGISSFDYSFSGGFFGLTAQNFEGSSSIDYVFRGQVSAISGSFDAENSDTNFIGAFPKVTAGFTGEVLAGRFDGFLGALSGVWQGLSPVEGSFTGDFPPIGSDVFFGVSAASLNDYKVFLGGSDITGQVVAPITITRSVRVAAIAVFGYCSNTTPLLPTVLIRKPVTIMWDDEVIYVGVVNSAEWNPKTRRYFVRCSDLMQEVFENLTEDQILSLIPDSKYSVAVFGDRRDGWTQAQDILGTVRKDVFFDRFGNFRVTDWVTETIPDYSFTASEILYDGKYTLSLASAREVLTQYRGTYSYQVSRWKSRVHHFAWSLFNSSINDWCDWAIRYGTNVPTKEMITSAIGGTGWGMRTSGFIVTGSLGIAFKEHPDSGSYCGSPPIVNWVISEEAREATAIAASWSGEKHWAQTIRENYEIVLDVSLAQVGLGIVSMEETANFDLEVDDAAFENSTQGDVIGWSQDSLGDYFQDQVDELARQNDIETLYQVGVTRLWDALRHNFVSVSIEIQPTLSLGHTVQIDTQDIFARGRVSELVHRIDASKAVTEISIALAQGGGGSDSEFTVPDRPNSSPTHTASPSSTSFPTRIGGCDNSPTFDETWDGWVTNRFSATCDNPGGVPDEEQIYPEKFQVSGPDIEDEARNTLQVNSSTTYDIAIPDDPLTLF